MYKMFFPSVLPLNTARFVPYLPNDNWVNAAVKFDILDALEICLDQNYFLLNSTIYSSNNGLIMGNPFSALQSQIFMNEFDRNIHEHPLLNSFVYW